MNRAGAARHHHRELARIETALDRDLAHALRHVGAGNAVHAGCCRLDIHAKRLADMFANGLSRGIDFQFDLAPGEEVGIQVTENEIRIRTGG